MRFKFFCQKRSGEERIDVIHSLFEEVALGPRDLLVWSKWHEGGMIKIFKNNRSEMVCIKTDEDTTIHWSIPTSGDPKQAKELMCWISALAGFGIKFLKEEDGIIVAELS